MKLNLKMYLIIQKHEMWHIFAFPHLGLRAPEFVMSFLQLD